jgi:hypothetical protein
MGKRQIVCWALVAALTGVAAGGRHASAHAADLYTDGSPGGPNPLAALVVIGGVAAAGYALYRRQAPARRRPSVPRPSVPRGARSQERLVAPRATGDPPPTNRGRYATGARAQRRPRRRR